MTWEPPENIHVSFIEEYEAEHTKPYRMHAVPDSFLLAAPDPAQLLRVCEAAHATLAAAQQARDASAKPEDARSHEALLPPFPPPSIPGR